MNPNTKPTATGANRTGIATSPLDAKKLVEGATMGVSQPSFDTTALEQERLTRSREAEPVGTMPPPASLKQAAKTVIDTLKGERTNVFVDLLGERLAFERTGTRLYESLLVKLAAADAHPGGPTRAELEEIRNDELAHAALLTEAITGLGGDPTVMTPCANISAVASEGVLKVLADPRTTFTEALKAILIAELTDNDGWAMLADLADKLEQQELASEFRDALEAEEEHLARVRLWLQASIEGQAGVAEKDDGTIVQPTVAP
jgi:rubrerythrin